MLAISCREGQQSDQLAKLNTGNDAAYRLALHPSGRHIVCGMSAAGLERVDLHPPSPQQQNHHHSGGSGSGGGGEALSAPTLSFAQEGEFKEATRGVGAVKGMSFSSDGRLLALGGEDGSVEVREWPLMQRRLRWQASEKPIRNVDFSTAHSDGVLFTCDEAGACKLWDAHSGAEITQLQPPAGEGLRAGHGAARWLVGCWVLGVSACCHVQSGRAGWLPAWWIC